MRAIAILIVLMAARSSMAAPSAAEQLYDEGQRAFEAHDYSTAIQDWESSYALSQQPLLVLNIAQAYRLAGNCTKALATYRRYIALDPTSDQRGLAEGFVAELSTCGARPVSRTDSTRSGHSLRLAGIVTGGGGIVSLLSGLAVGEHAVTIGDRVTSACSVLCDWGAQRDADASGRRDAKIGYALDALGFAAIASGAVMCYLGSRESVVTIAPTGHDDGAVLSWNGRW